jgi:arylsulfatase A-like enzyme
MDPHVPYRAHDGSNAKLGYEDIERLLAGENGARRAAEEVGRMYDAAIAFVDGCVGRVLARVDGSASLGATAVLFTSDHGEEILERWRAAPSRPAGLEYYYRGYGHGHTMYNELLRVPMILRLPARPYSGTRLAFPVGHIDVAPTLLALARVTSDNPRYQPEGIDLAPHLGAGGDEQRVMRSEATIYGPEVKALTVGQRKIISRAADDRRERYDLAEDAAERKDVEDAASFAPLDRLLEGWLASVPPEPDEKSPGESGPPSLEDEQLRRQLEALGYVQ